VACRSWQQTVVAEEATVADEATVENASVTDDAVDRVLEAFDQFL
jgi:hypothetical protein